jgi:hypothetical protein
MSVGTLLAPQTELQPWSSLYANSLHVESLTSTGTIVSSGQSFEYYTSAPGGTQSIPNATATPITFLTVQGASQGSDIKIIPGGPLITFETSGRYAISFCLNWSSTSFGAETNVLAFLADTKTAVSYLVSLISVPSLGTCSSVGTIMAPFSAGQSLNLVVSQNSGAAATVGSGTSNPDSFISVYRLV